MKRYVFLLLMIFCLVGIKEVNAETIRSEDIEPSTYVIGKYMFTRDTTASYDGRLTTRRIMLGSKTIENNTEDGMIIYYKNARGQWINALTGNSIYVPTTFEIEVTNLEASGQISDENPNNYKYTLGSDKILSSTYIIGDNIFTRNSNAQHNYNGRLTTQRIMLAAKTINSQNENNMTIYYKTARGQWIDALSGEAISPPTNFNIGVVDLVNQKNEKMITEIITGTEFNKKIKQLAGNNNASYSTEDNNITSIEKANSIDGIDLSDDNIISGRDKGIPVYAWYKNGTLYYYPEHYFDNVTIKLNSSSTYMFSNLKKITSIDLSNFDTSQVTYTYSMFNGCSSLTTLNLSNFNTSQVTDMSRMFYNCGNLTTLNLSNFDTSQVNNMYGMFCSCSSLTTLDLSSFDMSKVTSVVSMFQNMSSLKTLVTPKVYSAQSTNLFKKMYDSNENEIQEMNSSIPTKSTLKTRTVLIYGSEFNKKIKLLAGNENATYNTVDQNITKIQRETNKNNVPNGVIENANNIVSVADSYYPIYVWYNNGTLYYYTDSSVIYLNQGSSYLFSNLKNVTSIDLSIFNTSQVTDMSRLFYGCSSLTALDLSNFDMSEVVGTSSMLYDTSSLKTLVTPKVYSNHPITLFKKMYDSNENEIQEMNSSIPTKSTLKTRTVLIYGSEFNRKIKLLAGNENANYNTIDQNITKIQRETNKNNIPNGVIENANNIVSVADSYYPIYAWYNSGILYYYTDSNVIYLSQYSSYLFNNLKNVTSIDLSIFNTSQVTDMSYMFNGCSSLTALDLSNFDTSQVTNMSHMFYYCYSLTSLNISNFNTSQVTNMTFMFYYCKNLESLNVSSFNTSQVTDMSYMFNGCSGLTTLNLSNFNTSQVTNMYSMFERCVNLTSLNLSNFTTNQVTDMHNMFYGCNSLTTLNISNFTTNQVTDMRDMFNGCSSLESLNVSNFNTSQVTNMRAMFGNCSSLTTLNLSNFNTSQVTNMDYMFYRCSGLVTLDLSSFDLSKVTSVDSMLSSMTALNTLVTPKVNASIDISLPKTMYFKSNNTGISKITSTTATKTTIKSSTW